MNWVDQMAPALVVVALAIGLRPRRSGQGDYGAGVEGTVVTTSKTT